MREYYLASPISAHSRHAGKIPTKDIYITFVDRRPNMVEFGDESMFEPIHKHFREHDGQHRLMADTNQTLSYHSRSCRSRMRWSREHCCLGTSQNSLEE